jgi:hypothetical protein
MTLTADQITQVTDDLQALRDELRGRRWSTARTTEVLAVAAGYLIATARQPQVALPYPPPAYEPFGPPGEQLCFTVAASTRQELEDRALAQGKAFFGADTNLTVTVNGAVTPEGIKDSTVQYSCPVIVQPG